MKKILLLSDTHSHIDNRILHYAEAADEVWHAGDFGSLEVIDQLKAIKPLRGVYGNIDSPSIYSEFPEVLRFAIENVKILMIHIGGYPDKYSPLTKKELLKEKPDLMISGHSHILKVKYDQKNELLHLNPGAAGKQGWHQMRTMLRFEINDKQIDNLEVIELGKK